MRKTPVLTLPAAVVVASCLVCFAFAQQPAHPSAGGVAAASAADAVKIRRMIGAGPRLLMDTPKYQAGVSGGIKPVQKWAQVQVAYDTTPEWIDELAFQYFVMTRRLEAGKPTFSLFKVTVRYVDIKRGRDHVSTVFLRPTAMDRYGQVVASAVEISMGGQVVAEDAHGDGTVKLPDRWWRQPQVVESKDVAVREGYLLDRAHSPFALINIDDYETIRQ